MSRQYNYSDKYGSNGSLTNKSSSPNQYSSNKSPGKRPLNMNNQPLLSSNLNPSASPFTASYSVNNNSSFFNLTTIAKKKQELHNNISRPLQKLSSQNNHSDARNNHSEVRSNHSDSRNNHADTRSNHSSSSEQTSKKHKRDSKLDELYDKAKTTRESIEHYDRKRRRLLGDLDQIRRELKYCESSLFQHQNKLKQINQEIEREEKNSDSKHRSDSHSKSPNALDNLSNNKSPSHSQIMPNNLPNNLPTNQPSNSLSPMTNSGLNSINNLSLNNNNEQKLNAQFTINNMISSLLEKKKDVQFPTFDYIFTVIKEHHEPKPTEVAGNVYQIELNLNKLISTEEKKNGIRYIIRGCIYDSTSLYQTDNLSFVKSYDFGTKNKKHVYENHDTSSNKLMFPFDITDYCKFDRNLKITIHLDKKKTENKKIAFGVYNVNRLDYSKTLELIQKRDIIRKKKIEITKNQVTNSFNQIGGVAQEKLKIVLLDPLSKAKISMPCIGEGCEHINTFDGLTFLESNSKKFSWFCPICGRPIGYNQLFYDELINEILRKVSMDCTAIEFDKKSDWIPLSDANTNKKVDNDEDDCITLE